VNGNVVSDAIATGSPASATIDAGVAFPGGGWVAARCQPVSWAHTSPVLVRAAGQPRRRDPHALVVLRERLDHFIAWVERAPRFETERDRQRVLDIAQQARQLVEPR
jgi:hypothetical protein